ncbi:hypothetical protein C8Q72DRAFT_215119 [Fomitopsis betulina]|nr:hypothetical protein C8Q72DRAFT_215119 [Fomitopsis betulina]
MAATFSLPIFLAYVGLGAANSAGTARTRLGLHSSSSHSSGCTNRTFSRSGTRIVVRGWRRWHPWAMPGGVALSSNASWRGPSAPTASRVVIYVFWYSKLLKNDGSTDGIGCATSVRGVECALLMRLMLYCGLRSRRRCCGTGRQEQVGGGSESGEWRPYMLGVYASVAGAARSPPTRRVVRSAVHESPDTRMNRCAGFVRPRTLTWTKHARRLWYLKRRLQQIQGKITSLQVSFSLTPPSLTRSILAICLSPAVGPVITAAFADCIS